MRCEVEDMSGVRETPGEGGGKIARLPHKW
jgi:hypothetical protein